MDANRSAVSVSIEIPEQPLQVFDTFVEELTTSLRLAGMSLEAGPQGKLLAGEFEVGRVTEWLPGEVISLQWRQADWLPEEVTQVELRLESVEGGSRLTLSHRGWGGLIGGSDELVGWFASAVAGPLLRATAPAGLGDWLTDRRARRPSGALARGVYRDPLYHYPNFYAILAELHLTPDDYLVEVGCGGGAFLAEALKSGRRAAAVDHSPEMVRLAQSVNHDSVAQGRLTILFANADSLPFADDTFTCAVMTGVFGFLPDPVAALRELRRTLAPGGRLIVMGSDIAWRGTPAAPEPMASRLHFYTDDEFRQLARDAGFSDARVERRDLLPFAKQAGVPEDALPLFAGPGAPFLLARKG